MLSNTSKYAIRAVLYIAVHAKEGKKIGIKKISDALEIPSPFLSKILQVLVRKKILSSTKGPNGGFGVGKNPAKTTLYHIIYEMDGADLFESCLLGSGLCDGDKKKSGHCAVHNDFHDARKGIIDLYKNKTIAELAAKAEDDTLGIVL